MHEHLGALPLLALGDLRALVGAGEGGGEGEGVVLGVVDDDVDLVGQAGLGEQAAQHVLDVGEVLVQVAGEGRVRGGRLGRLGDLDLGGLVGLDVLLELVEGAHRGVSSGWSTLC